MKKIFFIAILLFLITSCSPSTEELKIAIEGTMGAFTPLPTFTPNATLTPYSTYTPYPTFTTQPTVAVTRMVIQTPTPNLSDSSCKPITTMDYSNNSKAFTMLQAYVATLPDVRSVSYTVNEKLYSNSLSHIVFVRYVSDSDGQVYSKRYIVYVDEFGWAEGVFSIDGQCWVDGPHD
jgi:hypothetical protein